MGTKNITISRIKRKFDVVLVITAIFFLAFLITGNVLADGENTIRGYHDYQQGDVPSWQCLAGGWAMDPDIPEQGVYVRILVDGNEVTDPFLANGYRPDLEEAWNNDEGGCPGGNCAFEINLWDYVIPSIGSEITVEAQDIQTEAWYPLYDTPKTITCRTYDIYTYDPITRETRAVMNLPDTHEFNPKWSPDGTRIVFTSSSIDFSTFGVYTTNVLTMESKPLVGAESGGFPAWSPNGKWISFDRDDEGTISLFRIPSSGGEALLVREDARMSSWSPDSRRLVFQQPSDGSIRTVDVNGRNETMVVPSGFFPAWSPNGQWIAYTDGDNIWKVRVNIKGVPLGEPVQLTNIVGWEGRVSWSQNSKTIVYHAGIGDDTDLWTIPASGGMPTWLTGAPGFGDYDPSYSNNGKFIAYSSFSPNGQAPREWAAAYTYDPPPGTFDTGSYAYHFEFEWNVPQHGFWDGQGGEIEVSAETPNYPGFVLLRGPVELRGFGTPDGILCEEIDTINPNQMTRFLVGFLPDFGEITYPEAQAHFESLMGWAVWNGDTAELMRHEIIPFNWDTWFQYVCGFTEAPPRMDLRVNYGDDWVESFYETGHEILITVTEDDGETVKATTTEWTEPKDFWNDETGFQTKWENWFDGDGNQLDAPPDIQPFDWVFAQVDNGVTAQVQIGEITGWIDLEEDSVVGKVNAPWFPDDAEVDLECHPWGAPEPQPDMKYDNVIPNADDVYYCTWKTDDGTEWDIQPGQVVGVGYFGPDGHWVANVIPNPWIMVFPEADQVFGYGWPEGSDVTLKIDGNEIMTVDVEGASWDENDIMAFFDLSGEPDLTAGDEIMLIGSGMDRFYTVQNLAISEINLKEDRVSGTADSSEWVHVWVHEYGYDVWVEVLNGTWDAFFGSDEFHLQPGMCGRAEIMGDGNNSTNVDWCIPLPSFAAYMPSAIEGYDWPMGDEISLTINGDEYPVIATSEQRPGFPEGETRVLFELWQHDISLQPYDHIVMTDITIGFSKELVVADLHVTDFDLVEHTISGIYEPSYPDPWVWLDGQEPLDIQFSDNTWTATFMAMAQELGGGVAQDDEDHDGTVWDFTVPWFVVKANQEWQNSGIYLTEGSFITIEANGEVHTVADGDSSGPDGQDWNPYCSQYTGGMTICALEDSPYGALVGKIGEDGIPFLMGSSNSLTPEVSGYLYLVVNDNLGFYEDNQGEFHIFNVDGYVPNPHFTIIPTSNEFEGYSWPDGATVSITVMGKSECDTSGESVGGFFKGSFPVACDIGVDDTVYFADGVITRKHIVQNLVITSTDPDTDTVYGIAYAYANVYIWPEDGLAALIITTANEDGNWVANFTGISDIESGDCGRAEVADPMNFPNSTAVYWCVE